MIFLATLVIQVTIATISHLINLECFHKEVHKILFPMTTYLLLNLLSVICQIFQVLYKLNHNLIVISCNLQFLQNQLFLDDDCLNILYYQVLNQSLLFHENEEHLIHALFNKVFLRLIFLKMFLNVSFYYLLLFLKICLHNIQI